MPSVEDGPVGVRVELAVIPAGPGGRRLLAHDRRLLETCLLHDLVTQHVLRTAHDGEDVEAAVTIEANARRRLLGRARRARMRRAAAYAAVLGLPVLVGAILGLVGLWTEAIPFIGEPLGRFLGTAGGSVGGLPLAIVVCAAPSAWLMRRIHRGAARAPFPADADEAVTATVTTHVDLEAFLQDAQATLQDLATVLGGNPRVSGERARRLSEHFERLRRVAGRHGVPSVRAFADDAAAAFRATAVAPQPLVMGLRRRRAHVLVAEVLAPYSPDRVARAGSRLMAPVGVLGGLVGAIALFAVSGVFRLNAGDALLVRPNEAFAFPSSAAVVSLGLGVDGPAVTREGTVSVLDGSGFYWAWARPLGDRTLLAISGRRASVEAPFLAEPARESVHVTFTYDVTDVKSFVLAGDPGRADGRVETRLAALLARRLLEVRRAEEQQAGTRATATVNQKLRAGMGSYLNDFVTAANGDAELGRMGVLIRNRPEFRFARS
ncbi:MAG: hypothetical protein FJ029_15665 [Actinobacteria bacterium]|nr:hypothetical protein [Actinomycetota bacterium]